MYTKSTGYDRSSYPFITEDGKRTLFTDAVDDAVLWVDPADVADIFPLTVIVELSNGTVILTISNDDRTYIVKASEGSSVLYRDNGTFVGYIEWNTEGLNILKNSLISNDPQPYNTVYMDPFACIPREYQPLSVVTINGEDVISTSSDIKIASGNNIDVTKKDNLSIVNVLAKITNKEDSDSSSSSYIRPVSKIEIQYADGRDPLTIDNVNGHVWLRSEAECDIRVVTTDEIILTEISNDTLQ